MHLNSLKDLGNQDINSELLHIIDFIFWKNGNMAKKKRGCSRSGK